MEIHFIKMNKFLKAWYEDGLNPLEDILARWLLLLGMVDARKNKVYDDIYKELEVLAMKDDHLLEAMTLWEYMSLSHEARIAYDLRMKAIIDEEAAYYDMRHKGLKEGFEKGLAEGKAEGIVEGIAEGIKQIVLTMIAKGKSDEEIMENTDLTLEEITAIRQGNS